MNIIRNLQNDLGNKRGFLMALKNIFLEAVKQFFQSFRQAKIVYDASGISNLTKTSEHKLTVCLQNEVRRALGLIRSTLIPILYNMAAELPFNLSM